MLAVISSNQPTPADQRHRRQPAACSRQSLIQHVSASPLTSRGLNTQAPNSISTTVKCRKRHSTIALVMNYWPTLKL